MKMKFLATFSGILCVTLTAMESNELTFVQKMMVNGGTIIRVREIDRAAIYNYPMGDILRKFRREYGVSEKSASIIEIEFKTFLIDSANTQMGIPYHRKKVNQLWHTFILHTREYQLFCFTFFGRMLHHHPGIFDELRCRHESYDSDKDSDEEDRASLVALVSPAMNNFISSHR